ncbi:DUF4397 domain-containing protein [Romboutsia weinsteinii]|uniref:DUF4397 domain-containing protein n=1 Tax=Romboutsia weinsteinii TaxID=2020949 RepID=A0A255IQ38_9FIRM|nr:DUF4397 domain-containing protein [Romboutsia weinsteinii]RDY29399.1 DUF4397 domain-containing protein [Romboutsia weinsteinii]
MDCLKPKAGNSLVRIFHAAPEAPAVDVYIDGKPFIRNISYKQFSKYVNVPENIETITLYVAGDDTQPVLEQDLDFQAGKIFTMAITGNLDNLSVEPLEESIDQMPSRDNTIVRFVHLSPNLQDIDILNQGEVIVSDLEFREFSDYMPFPFGDFRFIVQDEETKKNVAGISATLNAERIYSLYIIGEPQSLEVIQSVDGNTYACRGYYY